MSTDHLDNPTTVQPLMGRSPVALRSIDLNSGDEMTQEEFYRLYEQTPEDFKAELIGGVVYVASPLRNSHGESHASLSGPLVVYQAKTPGVRVSDNATVILGDDCEVLPDLLVRILPEF